MRSYSAVRRVRLLLHRSLLVTLAPLFWWAVIPKWYQLLVGCPPTLAARWRWPLFDGRRPWLGSGCWGRRVGYWWWLWPLLLCICVLLPFRGGLLWIVGLLTELTLQSLSTLPIFFGSSSSVVSACTSHSQHVLVGAVALLILLATTVRHVGWWWRRGWRRGQLGIVARPGWLEGWRLGVHCTWPCWRGLLLAVAILEFWVLLRCLPLLCWVGSLVLILSRSGVSIRALQALGLQLLLPMLHPNVLRQAKCHEVGTRASADSEFVGHVFLFFPSRSSFAAKRFSAAGFCFLARIASTCSRVHFFPPPFLKSRSYVHTIWCSDSDWKRFQKLGAFNVSMKQTSWDNGAQACGMLKVLHWAAGLWWTTCTLHAHNPQPTMWMTAGLAKGQWMEPGCN